MKMLTLEDKGSSQRLLAILSVNRKPEINSKYFPFLWLVLSQIFSSNLELQYTKIVLTFWYFQKNMAGSVQRQHLTSPTQNHYYMDMQCLLLGKSDYSLLFLLFDIKVIFSYKNSL